MREKPACLAHDATLTRLGDTCHMPDRASMHVAPQRSTYAVRMLRAGIDHQVCVLQTFVVQLEVLVARQEGHDQPLKAPHANIKRTGTNV